MKKITKPIVRTLATGEEMFAKQMKAKRGDILPKHLATMESVLIVVEGECVLDLDGTENLLKTGDAFVVPPKIKHQITATENLRAIHVMPKEIKFEYFTD